jgi:hypothetical protein
MPAWWQVAGAIFSGLGAISSILGGRSAASAARKQGREEARLEGIVTAEKVRQIGVEERITRGETIAGYAGSGVKAFRGVGADPARTGYDPSRSYGSPLSVLAESAREFARERHITQQVGATRASQALQGAKATADRYKTGGYAQGLSQIGSIFSMWRPT